MGSTQSTTNSSCRPDPPHHKQQHRPDAESHRNGYIATLLQQNPSWNTILSKNGSRTNINCTSFNQSCSSWLSSPSATVLCDAVTAPPPPPPLPAGAVAPPPPPPLESGSADDSIARAAASVSNYTNPGPYEHVLTDIKQPVMMDNFDGFRCDINKQISPHMMINHGFWLGSSLLGQMAAGPGGGAERKNSYSFFTQVADESGFLFARVDPTRGSVDGRVQRAILGGLAMAKLQLALSVDGQQDQAVSELDFGGTSWSANLKYGTMGGAPVWGASYLQAITPNLCMGGEGLYVATNGNTLSSYTLKYKMPAKTGEEDAPIQLPTTPSMRPPGAPPAETGSSTIGIQINPAHGALIANYKRVVTPDRVMLGAELNCSIASLESDVKLGALFQLTRSKLAVTVDGSGVIQSRVDAKLGMAPGSPSVMFAAHLDHLKSDMRFGYGLTFEG
jgi:mitochondrial import receptor subunit TOM40